MGLKQRQAEKNSISWKPPSSSWSCWVADGSVKKAFQSQADIKRPPDPEGSTHQASPSEPMVPTHKAKHWGPPSCLPLPLFFTPGCCYLAPRSSAAVRLDFGTARSSPPDRRISRSRYGVPSCLAPDRTHGRLTFVDGSIESQAFLPPITPHRPHHTRVGCCVCCPAVSIADETRLHSSHHPSHRAIHPIVFHPIAI